VSRVLRHTQHKTGHIGDETFQAIVAETVSPSVRVLTVFLV